MNSSQESTVCSGAPLHMLLDTIPKGLFSIDLEGHCTFANRAAARLLGYEAKTLPGRDMHALILHSYADGSPYPRSQSPFHRAAHTGQTIQIDMEVFWRKDGSAFAVEYTCLPLVEASKVQGVVVTFTDATMVERLACKNAALLKANEALQFEVAERKRAEAAVRVSETRFRTQFEQSPVSMQILSPDGWTLRVNRAWEKLFGLTLADVAGYNML
ncbi:MAG: PAS domain S-box protein, partial [Gemmatimonadaceae bacterium]|nr:PAS domain S-box protein [Gloeobacterales cyanobacterium ES-bin-141]